MVQGEKRDIERAPQDAYLNFICKGLGGQGFLLTETAADSLGPVAMREWRFRAPDHESRAYFYFYLRGSSRRSSPAVQRRSV